MQVYDVVSAALNAVGENPAMVYRMSKSQLFLPPVNKRGNYGKFAALMHHLQGQRDPTSDTVG